MNEMGQHEGEYECSREGGDGEVDTSVMKRNDKGLVILTVG